MKLPIKTAAAALGAAFLSRGAAGIPLPSLPPGSGEGASAPGLPPAAPFPAPAPAGTVPAGHAATELLSIWDRAYRLLDAEIETPGRAEQRNYARGIAELKKAIVAGIPDREMYYRLGFCYEKLGDHDRALDAFRRAAERGGGDPEWERVCALPYHTGLVLAAKGLFAEAAVEFGKAAGCPEYAAAARNNLGSCYRSLYLKRKAIGEFEAALSLDPQMAEAWSNIGITRAELGDTQGAVSDLRRAQGIDPLTPGAAYRLGVVLEARGDPRGAEEAFARAVSACPRDEKAHLALARLYLASGRREDARREARIAFGLMPTLKADNLELDNVLGAPPPPAAAPPAAADRLEKSLARGRAALDRGDHAAAGREYAAALAENPRSVAACLGMAYLCEFAGDERYGKGFPAERSIGYYRKALGEQPGMSTAWFSLGVVCEKSGRYPEAAEAFEKASECAPGMRFAWYNCGVCLMKMGEQGKAEEKFREAVRIDPDFAAARCRLAEALAARRDFGGAIAEYERALEHAPAAAEAHFGLGQIYRLRSTDRRKAAGHFRAYHELLPAAADAAEVQGWIRELEE